MARGLVHRSAVLHTRADGALRVAVVADTHSRPHPATDALLRQYAPDAILHAGDIGDLQVLDALGKLAPLHAVRGNIDADAARLPDALTLTVLRGEEPVLRLLLVHIGVSGAKIRAEVAKLARAEGASLVVCGHSHVPFIGRDRGLAVFNPGSIGPRRFHLPIVFGLIEVSRHEVRLRHVDAETGQEWSSPRAAQQPVQSERQLDSVS